MRRLGAQGLSRGRPPFPSGATVGNRSGEPVADPAQLSAKVRDLKAAAVRSEGEGDREGALSLRLKAAMLLQSLSEPSAIGEVLVECASSFTAMGEYREAALYLERARDIAAEGHDALKGEVYRGYGALYRARGRAEEAAVCFDRALERLEFSSRHDSALHALIELSEIYLAGGRAAEAGSLLARAKALPPGADPSLLVRLELNVGRLAFLGGDRASAVMSYELAARAADRAGRPNEREVVALGLAGLYVQEGRLGEAAAALRQALALSIVAFARESSRPLERRRFETIAARLEEIDMGLDATGAGSDTRRQVDEAVRLFNAHPLVLVGDVPAYGTVRAEVEAVSGPAAAESPASSRAEIATRSDPPNPK